MRERILQKIIALATAGAAAVSAVPFAAAADEDTWQQTFTGLEEGYYDLTATYTNTSVDGSCYIWAKSTASNEATTVLPKTCDTSGTTVTVRGVYVDDGVLEAGLYNDGTSEATISDASVSKSSEYTFLNGGDISEYTIVKDNGGKYYDLDGTEVNPIEYLAQNGMNACRIRLSNDPGPGHGDGTYYLAPDYQNEEDCLNLAKAAKDAGMQIVFTFNYSDYWSNAERQRIPADWVQDIKDTLGYDIESADFLASMTSAQKTEIKDRLAALIGDYTRKVMRDLREQGTVPEYVSIGNEINGGICFPFANSYDAYFNADSYELEYEATDTNVPAETDFAGIAQLLNSAYDAIKEVSPNTQVIIHLASDDGFKYSNAGNHKWWFDGYKNAGGKWDVTGISYYPAWTDQTASVCKTRVNELSSLLGKPVILMEAGYNWNPTKKDGYEGQLSKFDPYGDIYPGSQSGQKGFLTELVNYMKQADNCLGVLYWDPLKIHVEDADGNNLIGWAYRESDGGVESNVVENTTLFDFDGKATSAVELYRDSKNAKLVKQDVRISDVTHDDDGNLTVKTDAEFHGGTADLYTAIYDSNGVLKSLKITKDVRSGEHDITIKPGDDAENVKVFMWKKDAIEPFTKSASKPIK